MPIPKPRDNEAEEDFISRCMGDDTMTEEYPENEQRLAICYQSWRNRNKQHPHGDHICVCPECGATITISESEKCNEQKCPECGARMRAEETGERRQKMDLEHKSIQMELKADQEGSFIAKIAELNVIDLDGDVTLPGAFPEGKEVVISAYQHGSWMGELPVGKAAIRESGDQVLAEGQFNLKTQTGKEHYETVKFSGGLQEWSYGFKATTIGTDEELEQWAEAHGGNMPARILVKLQPFEMAPVLKGAGKDTATLSIKSENKGAISYNSAHPNGTPKAAEDAEWDAGAEVREADVDDLKIMCAYVDSDADPDNKTSYKLPHHKASGQHSVVWKGVAAAMAALLGARGGVAAPSSAKKGIYNHLSRHYKEFDKEPPEFRSAESTYADQAEITLAAVDDLVIRTQSLADLRRKEGRVLSESNRTKMKKLLSSLSEVANDLKELLDSTEPVDKAAAEKAFAEFIRLDFELTEVSIK